jgi:hypothetical protein
MFQCMIAIEPLQAERLKAKVTICNGSVRQGIETPRPRANLRAVQNHRLTLKPSANGLHNHGEFYA